MGLGVAELPVLLGMAGSVLCYAWWCHGILLSPRLGGSIQHFTMQEAVLEREHIWHTV